ncbi:hypothetical protein SISSUDRAFT_995005, partial [Sistotremastrum suecicum HHB10207 ss-3]
VWLRSLMKELGFSQNNPTTLFCDNQGTVLCTHNPQSHSALRHNPQSHSALRHINIRINSVPKSGCCNWWRPATATGPTSVATGLPVAVTPES